MITVWPADGDDIRWLGVNGYRITGGGGDDTGRLRSIVHWGTPEDALLLDLQPAPGADSVRLVVVEHLYRPAELVAPDYFIRPADLVANTGGLSDRAVLRSVVTVVLEAPEGPGPTTEPFGSEPPPAPADTIPVASPDTASAGADDTTGIPR